ncbi:MAG: anti-sigma factor [Polaromonas sp.]|nr:anti-sigma factor [Polaromonas sp.]
MNGLHTPGADNASDIAGEYVLGTLSSRRRREVEHQLPHDPVLRAAVEGWQEKLLPLTALARPVQPSADLWSRIENSVTAAAAAPPAVVPLGVPISLRAGNPRLRRPSAAASWWSSLQLWRGLAGTGFAAAAVMAAVLVTRMGAPAAPQYMVVLVAPQDKAPGWVVQASSTREVSLIPLGDTVVPAEKSLQFWTKGDSWSGPVSLGLVKPGQTITVPLDKLPPLQANQLFELTLEPVNGSPLNRPTGPIQFIGRAVKVL